MRSIHYPISLPAGFDMAAIERRVRERSAVFDAMSGLCMKSFLVRSIEAGHPENAYAPFYVWNDAAQMRDFLAGPIFEGVIDTFGLPAVLDREVLHYRILDRAIAPTVATIETVASRPGVLPLQMLDHEESAHRALAGVESLYAAVTLWDTTTWTATRFRLWADARRAPAESRTVRRFTALATTGPDVRNVPAIHES